MDPTPPLSAEDEKEIIFLVERFQKPSYEELTCDTKEYEIAQAAKLKAKALLYDALEPYCAEAMLWVDCHEPSTLKPSNTYANIGWDYRFSIAYALFEGTEIQHLKILPQIKKYSNYGVYKVSVDFSPARLKGDPFNKTLRTDYLVAQDKETHQWKIHEIVPHGIKVSVPPSRDGKPEYDYKNSSDGVCLERFNAFFEAKRKAGLLNLPKK